MADAVLYAWHPGVEGGHAVADLIFGAASPSGRLPISFPRAVGQVPVYYSHKNTGRPPQPERFSNGYLDLPTTPLYPFGYGLSYTTFAYSDLQVETPSFPADRQGTFSVSVTNTGGRPGVEVAQLYIRDLVGQVTRPVKELKGFERVALQPGETRQVRFRLPGSALAFAGVQDQMVVEPGRYQVWIGPSSADGLQGEFTLTA
jgi:beta-glucosidase